MSETFSSLPALSRRSLLGALGLAGAGAALSACGAPGGGTGGGQSPYKQAAIKVPAEYQGRTAILFWAPWTAGPFEAVAEMLKQFNQSQSDIVAVAEPIEGYAALNQKLTAALQARQVPDIVCFPELQWLQFYFSGVFAELDPYFTADWSLDNYITNYVNEGRAGGKTYLVPFARSTPLFYFNRDTYARLGLPVEGPKTWDDLASYGAEIGKQQVNGKPLKTFAFGADDAWYGQAGIWAWGGQNSRDFDITISDGAGVAWLDWQRDFIHAKKLGYMAKAPLTDFTTGLAAGAHGSTASLTGTTKNAKFDVGVSYMLGQVNKPTKVPTGGSGLAIVKAESKERQDACAELFKFLAKPDVSAYWHLATGYVPIAKAAQQEATVKDRVTKDPNYGVALAQLENARTADRINWFQSAVTEIGGAQAKVYGDNTPAAEALGGIKAKLEKIMRDNKENLEKVLAG